MAKDKDARPQTPTPPLPEGLTAVDEDTEAEIDKAVAETDDDFQALLDDTPDEPIGTEGYTDDDVAGELPVGEDGYLLPPEAGEDGTVVVQDFDPADPGAEIEEPQKILRVDGSRQQRKAAQRAKLDK